MKKTIILILVGVFFVCATLTVAFFNGFNLGKQPDQTPSVSTEPTGTVRLGLPVPKNVRLDGVTLLWGAVEKASGYTVYVSGATYTLPKDNNDYNLPANLTEGIPYVLKVKALGDGDYYSDSAYSAEKLYVKTAAALDAPGNLRVEGVVLKWDAVTNAVGYKMIIDGTEQPVGLVASYGLSALGLGVHNLKVKALGGDDYSDSPYSAYQYQNTQLLSAPGSVRVEGNVFKWDAVANATGYQIIIDDGAEQSVSIRVTSYGVSSLDLGIHSLKVKAVGGGDYSDSPYSAYQYKKTRQLAAPGDAVIDGTNFVWNAVANASGYRVSVNDTEYSADGTSYSLSGLTVLGVYIFKVKALGDNIRYTDSDYSSPAEYTKTEQLSVPGNVRVDGTNLVWNNVPNATGYNVKIDGMTVSGKVLGVTYDFSDRVSSFVLGYHTFAVMAVGGDYYYTDSAYSTSDVKYQKTQELAAPGSVRIDGANLKWDAVSNASGYRVKIDGAATGTYVGSVTSYSATTLLTSFGLGYHTFEVMAEGGGNYTNSLYSTPVQYQKTQQLAAPGNLGIDGTTLRWNAVEHTTGYKVRINGGTESGVGNVTSCSITAILSSFEVGDYTFEVIAVGGGNYTNSVYSIQSTAYRKTAQLAMPGNVRIEEKSLKWDGVTNATGYRVKTDGVTESGVGNVTSYSAATLLYSSSYGLGEHTFEVMAVGGDYYTNSAYSNSGVTYANGVFILIKDGTEYELAEGCNMEDVTIPSMYKGLPVTSIGSHAFFSCMSLLSVTLPAGLTNISDHAFYFCESLRSINLPEGLTSIGVRAFRGCRLLASITIPASVVNIDWGAFEDCDVLTINVRVYTNATKPAGWDGVWNYSNRPVNWDYRD